MYNVNEIMWEKRMDINKKYFYIFVKRFFDVVFSISLILLLLPIFLLVSILIFIDNPGPIVYGQERVGVGGKIFKMWKFRSMYINSDKIINKLSSEQILQYSTEYKIDNDPRITKIGKFIRKTSIDELPQLFNVIFNDMSLVGPRPILKEEMERYYSDTWVKLVSIKPGLTGYWQAFARNNASYQKGERQKMELYYVDHASLSFDIKILVKTVFTVLKREGAK